MAIDDLPWRKFPRDAIGNVKIRFIQKQLPAHLKHCALLFFVTAYCIADDYGAFDLEDGLVCADAMDIDNPDDVFLIAEHFARRGVINKITDRVYMFVDWDAPSRERASRSPLTAEQRREAVRARLKIGTPEAEPPIKAESPARKKKDVATKSEKMSLHGECSDKKRENVATQRERRERTETEEREKTDKTDTHTYETAALAQAALSAHGAPCGAVQAAAQTDSREPEEQTDRQEHRQTDSEEAHRRKDGTQRESYRDSTEQIRFTAEQTSETVKTITVGKGSTDTAAEACYGDSVPEYVATVDILSDFFLKNNPKGYPDRLNEQKAIMELAKRIVVLRDKDNTHEIIAVNFCRCFKKLTEQHRYYKAMALLPSNLLKPGAFSVVFGEVGRILKPKGTDWQKNYDRMVAESLKDRAVYGENDVLSAEYAKYGIASDDPERFGKLLHAKKAAGKEKQAKEYVDDS